MRLGLLFVAVTFTFTIGYSRLILGAHAWNQLLFGWQLGIWLALSYFFCYKAWLDYKMARLAKGKEHALQKYIIWGALIFAVTMTIEIVNYEVVMGENFTIPQLWIDNITTKCPGINL